MEAPPTALYQLKRLRKDIGNLDVIFISGLEGERTFGLPFLLAERALSRRTGRPLWVVGPRGIADYGMAQLRAAFPGMADEIAAQCRVKWEEVDDDFSRNQLVAYLSIRLPGSGVAYRILVEGRALAYARDALCRETHALLDRGADAWVLN
ncbi:MAG: hypothetical protein FJX76_14320, partial [Armatimonadetes bacterium]|nr:hypothetical protein [Armatimonadota bacterium]